MGFLRSTTGYCLNFGGFINIGPLHLLFFIPSMIPKHLSKPQLFNSPLLVADPLAMHSLLSLLLLSSMVQFTWGWGDLGHRTVAYLAEKFLNEQGAQLVEDLIAPNETFDISDAAVWADKKKFRYPFTRPWHFIGMYRC